MAESAVEQSLDLNSLLHLVLEAEIRVLLMEVLLGVLKLLEDILVDPLDKEELVLTV